MRVKSFKRNIFVFAGLTCVMDFGLVAQNGIRAKDFSINKITERIQKPPSNGELKPHRNKPIFEGAFSVGCILIRFPDTKLIDLDRFKNINFNFGRMSVKEYYINYSQGLAWPELYVMGEESFPNNIYTAKELKGYYCAYHSAANPIGWKDETEGQKRVSKLRQNAKKFALSKSKRPKGINTKSGGEPHVLYYFYELKLLDKDKLKPLVEHLYPRSNEAKKPRGRRGRRVENTQANEYEYWRNYNPTVRWAEPLWPSAVPQQGCSDGGGTLAHELGHVLGAPDFYHATEYRDGVEGTPCINLAFGPTGPGYCRYIYQGFLSKENYPTIRNSGEYTLYKRALNPAESYPLGFLIPSRHSHYIYNIEYISGERPPLQAPSGARGVMVNLINTTKTSPFLGSPDLCYTYRENDHWLQGTAPLNTRTALFSIARRKSKFGKNSNPSSMLPTLNDGGLSFEILEETNDYVRLKIEIENKPLTGPEYKSSLIPKIKLDKVSESLPHSFRAFATIKYRGEPLKQEYGFCYSKYPNPNIKNNIFPLYHRDRYNGRVIGLEPNTKYYVKAYVKSSSGLSYSDEELSITTLKEDEVISYVPPLLIDHYTNSGIQSSLCAVMKYTAYYRRSIDPKMRLKKFDFTRIHTKPSNSKPPHRMLEFYAIVDKYREFVKNTNMSMQYFTEDFDKLFQKRSGLKKPYKNKLQNIYDVSTEVLPSLYEPIRNSLVNSRPVLLGLDTSEIEITQPYPIHWLIIDGYDQKGNFHFVVPNTSNLNYRLRSGWYTFEKILKNVDQAKIIFNWPNFR